MISHGISWAWLDSFMPQRRLHSENWKINHLSHTYNKSLKSDRVRSWYCILTAYHVKWNCGFRFTLLNEIIFLWWFCVIKIWFVSQWNSSISLNVFLFSPVAASGCSPPWATSWRRPPWSPARWDSASAWLPESLSGEEKECKLAYYARFW